MAQEGIREWRNTKNGFYIARVHYTADPAKRALAWRDSARAAMPERGWKREYEIDWTAPAGEPVVPEFDPLYHVKEFPVIDKLRMLRGWDFGYVTPAALIGQLDLFGRLLIHAEVVPFNTPLPSMIQMVHARTFDLSPNAATHDAGDPAADSKTDLGSVRQVLAQHGVHLAITRPGTEESYESLRARMLAHVHVPGVGQVPAFQVHPRCVTLIEALSGAFHLSENPPYKPIQNHPYKDVVDALRYLIDNLSTMNMKWEQDMRKMAVCDRVW
jgi:hypothetical protein